MDAKPTRLPGSVAVIRVDRMEHNGHKTQYQGGGTFMMQTRKDNTQNFTEQGMRLVSTGDSVLCRSSETTRGREEVIIHNTRFTIGHKKR